MRFRGDIQIRFPCRGAAFEPSPAFQRRERRNLDLPVAERRLSEDSYEFRGQTPSSHGEIVRHRSWSTIAPRLWNIIARFPALKRLAKFKRRSAAERAWTAAVISGGNN